MSETDEKGRIYVFSIAAVKRAVEKLSSTPSHEHFPGYLAIATKCNGFDAPFASQSDIVKFYDDYLRVPEAPDESPYLRPFKSRGFGPELMNKNVAGSYAPSSIRAGGKFQEVIEVAGARKNAKYSLRPDHASKVLDRLLSGHKVPAASLMVFLLRDYGFKLSNRTVADAMLVFRTQFALRSNRSEERKMYDTLFEDDSSDYSDSDLIDIGNS